MTISSNILNRKRAMKDGKGGLFRQVTFVIIVFGLLFTSCEKFLEVSPPKNQLSTTNVFIDSLSATNALLGIYSSMMSGPNSCIGKIVVTTGMCSDELNTSLTAIDFVTNDIQVGNVDVNTMWGNYYTYIYQANAVLEGLAGAAGISESAKNQISGEALFLRAWCYLHLRALWGDVPLIRTTNYRLNGKAPRQPADSVIMQVISDLIAAKNLLSVSYISADKTRPNKWAAAGLLARAYLYNNDWINSERQSGEVIESQLYSPLPALENVFVIGSKETIWQCKSVNPAFNAPDGNILIPANNTQVPNYSITDTLLAAFDPIDRRKSVWLNYNQVGSKRYYYPYKYRVRNSSSTSSPTEYPVMIRLSEILLIHAEASANLNKNDRARDDLNIIRNRAGLGNLPDDYTLEQIKAAIEKERRIELFVESGHRWLDIKRTPSIITTGMSRADDLIGQYKPDNWQHTDVLWPVPNDQRIVNPALTQNDGYN